MTLDFAAAAMMRLMAQGMRLQGLTTGPGAGAVSARPSAARVPLADKRAVLAHIAQAHGPLALLRVGAAVQQMGDEPTLAALTLARSPHDMLARWMRLERFIHSRHRVVVLASDLAQLSFQHVSTVGEPPTQAEDLLIAGLLVALAELTGAARLQAKPIGHPHWLYSERRWAWPQHGPDLSAAEWELRWSAEPASSALAHAPVPEDVMKQARDVLRRDPGAAWTVHQLAQRVGTSARSLQRALAAQGTRFTTVLADVRLAAASRLLLGGTQSPAEIGYLCGYADQAHFTREFKRQTALTPAQFRQKLADAGR